MAQKPGPQPRYPFSADRLLECGFCHWGLWVGINKVLLLTAFLSVVGAKPLLAQTISLEGRDSDADRDGVYLHVGGYVHFTSREEHRGPPIVIAAERFRPNGNYYGLALFNNSFNQFSQFLYVGREFPWRRVHENFRFKLSFGVVHGYRDEFEDELPLNYKGYSPGLVPSIGFQHKRVGFDLAVLANAGVLLSVGYEF